MPTRVFPHDYDSVAHSNAQNRLNQNRNVQSTQLPVIGVVATTYLTREAAKQALDHVLGMLIPGMSAGTAYSAARAEIKQDILQRIASRYYNPVDLNQKFPEDLDTVRDAIIYASQKKGTKADRQKTVAMATNVLGVGGGMAGAVVGSFALPVVGTVGGLAAGVAAGKGAVGVGYHLFRKAKWLYKTVNGTQGVHRHQAADLLYSAATKQDMTRDKLAATAALLAILGAEYDHFMAKPDLALERIASRLKSV